MRLQALLAHVLLWARPALMIGQIHFTATLSGAQQNLSVSTTAGGTGLFVLSDDQKELKDVLTYQRSSGTLSVAGHFHAGKQEGNGSTVRNIVGGGDASAGVQGCWKSTDAAQPLTPAGTDQSSRRIWREDGSRASMVKGTWARSDESQPLSLGNVDSLIEGKYVNFRTTVYPGGENRGQLKHGADKAVASVQRIDKETPIASRLYQNYPNPLNPFAEIRFQITRAAQASLKVFHLVGRRLPHW